MTAAPSMAFACVYPNEVPVSFMHSWTNLLTFDLANWGVLTRGPGLISVRYGTDGLVAARNTVVEQFLASGADWLFWCDSDMGFSPDAVYKLLAVADPVERPIVGGLCFASREYASDGMGGYRTKPSPTIFQMAEVDGVQRPTGGHMYPVNSMVKCAATGSAFLVIHRGVLEKLGSGWYDRIPAGDGLMGEDVSFCLRAAEAGFPTHVFTGARTSHFKPQWVQEADYWSAMVPPPATDRTAVIVPVLGRPQNAEPFMRSLRASTGLVTVYAVADAEDRDTVAAWTAAGADVVLNLAGTGDPGTFARKVNIGCRESQAPWLFLTGDDVRFRAGWLDHAQHVAKTWNASVVGVDDGGGDARTAAGEHAAHLLISREYVEQVGASWDGPGLVCHEGYRHWYVDDEIVTAAKRRRVWQMAPGAVVEHLHPLFGKADEDPVYELGQSHVDTDRALFKTRAEQHRAS